MSESRLWQLQITDDIKIMYCHDLVVDWMRAIREIKKCHRVYSNWAASLPWCRLQSNRNCKTLRHRDQ